MKHVHHSATEMNSVSTLRVPTSAFIGFEVDGTRGFIHVEAHTEFTRWIAVRTEYLTNHTPYRESTRAEKLADFLDRLIAEKVKVVTFSSPWDMLRWLADAPKHY